MVGIFVNCCCLSQITSVDKGVIDTAAVRESENWPSIGFDISSLSPDGRYVAYTVDNEPARCVKLVVESTDGAWKKEIIGAQGGEITTDSRWVVYKLEDSLFLLGLERQDQKFLAHASRHELIEKNGSNWLMYYESGTIQDLVLRNLSNDEEERFPGCINFWLDERRHMLLWESKKAVTNGFLYDMQWMDLAEGKVHSLRLDATDQAFNIALEPGGEVVLYTTLLEQADDSLYRLHWCEIAKGTDKVLKETHLRSNVCQFDGACQQILLQIQDTVWYYRKGMDKLTALITRGMPGLENRYEISNPVFSGDGNRVLFNIVEKQNAKMPILENNVKLVVWHYCDKVLPSAKGLVYGSGEHVYSATLNLRDRKVLRIDSIGEEVLMFGQMSRYVLLTKAPPSGEGYWQEPEGPELNLVSLEDGGRQRLKIDMRYLDPVVQLSPREDYVVYYDPVNDGYCSYGMADGKTQMLTQGLGMSWRQRPFYRYFNSPNPFFGVDPRPRGLAGWVEGDSMVLAYDSYDIWKLDPSGRRAPENMTQGYGRRHHVVFELDHPSKSELAISGEKKWILSAFNMETKEEGYYSMRAGKTPELFFMGLCRWGIPIKAKSSEVWIISRNSSSEASSVYIKLGDKAPTCLRSVGPPSQYNWYTSELVSWRLPDGTSCQGVLYKPKDLDTSRKYPILFNYYQLSSARVYGFIRPSLAASCDINVPYFVSRGYLVFKPDIYYRMGYPGESALASIVSGAEYLSKRRYVDRRKMGLAGHSWGGYETNYVVTHSHLFAAAAEGAGQTDFIARYNGLKGVNGQGGSNQPLYEIGQFRMGFTLWQCPDLYAKNSPILQADRITTPLLMLHNKEDEAVPWSQGVELFTALRRLGKRAWMLQYEGEGHILEKPENILDYTIRLTQFFDHYLKGLPAPTWMKEGI